MSDEPETTEAEEEASEEAAEDAPKKGILGNRKLLFAIPVILLLALGGGGYFAMTSFGILGGGAPAAAASKPALYYNLPDLVVNLSSTERRARFLRLKVSLEAEEPEVIEALEPVMPRVLDLFQLYLRELRSTDLDGSAGIFRLKEELLRRVNIEIHPNKVTRVLFKQIIVQ